MKIDFKRVFADVKKIYPDAICNATYEGCIPFEYIKIVHDTLLEQTDGEKLMPWTLEKTLRTAKDHRFDFMSVKRPRHLPPTIACNFRNLDTNICLTENSKRPLDGKYTLIGLAIASDDLALEVKTSEDSLRYIDVAKETMGGYQRMSDTYLSIRHRNGEVPSYSVQFCLTYATAPHDVEKLMNKHKISRDPRSVPGELAAGDLQESSWF